MLAGADGVQKKAEGQQEGPLLQCWLGRQHAPPGTVSLGMTPCNKTYHGHCIGAEVGCSLSYNHRRASLATTSNVALVGALDSFLEINCEIRLSLVPWSLQKDQRFLCPWHRCFNPSCRKPVELLCRSCPRAFCQEDLQKLASLTAGAGVCEPHLLPYYAGALQLGLKMIVCPKCKVRAVWLWGM